MQAQSLTCLAWSQTEQTLAAGTEKGSLILFNVGRRKREVVQGKHSRAVTCMAWSGTGLLAVAACDNKVGDMQACQHVPHALMPASMVAKLCDCVGADHHQQQRGRQHAANLGAQEGADESAVSPWRT